jgi:hypothetical protein
MPLLDFYRGEGEDHAGRTIEEIWGFSFEELEGQHDFIQWLFPIDTPSPVNPLAPILDSASANAFRQDTRLQAALLKSLDVMLAFYGLRRRLAPSGTTVERAPNFLNRAPEWLSPGDHNHRRISRILRCLFLCGLEAEAQSLLAALEKIARENPIAIDATTLRYWQESLRPR